MKILRERKIPYLETAHAGGRQLKVSIVLTLLTSLFVGGYIALMYYSGEFQTYETASISALAAIGLITYVAAVFVPPDYAELPAEKTEEQFLELLKMLAD